ncbi:unnamed protein product, partial [Mesorhabditis belari]|uniref:BHLH domain-containing protein n=1 Tax=Mesorhabditis belari TaxID=2138241 RepID=A0AAF3EKH5_9BILA
MSTFLSDIHPNPRFSPIQYEPQFLHNNNQYLRHSFGGKDATDEIAELLPADLCDFILDSQQDNDDEEERLLNLDQVSHPDYADSMTPLVSAENFETPHVVAGYYQQPNPEPHQQSSSYVEISEANIQLSNRAVGVPPHGEFYLPMTSNNDYGSEVPSTSFSPLSPILTTPSTPENSSVSPKAEEKKRGRKAIYRGDRNEKNKQSRDHSRNKLKQIHQNFEHCAAKLSTHVLWLRDLTQRLSQPFEMFSTTPQDAERSQEVLRIAVEIERVFTQLSDRHRKNGDRTKVKKVNGGIGKTTKATARSSRRTTEE